MHALVEAHYDIVWRVLRRLGLSAAAADDGAQQVFLVALQRQESIEAGKERAFLCATAVWVGRRLRAGYPREQLEAEPPESQSDVRPDDEVERRQLRGVLDRLLQKLDEDLRVVLVLMHIEGLTKKETAQALGIPEGTVSTRSRRAKQELDALAKAELERGGAR